MSSKASEKVPKRSFTTGSSLTAFHVLLTASYNSNAAADSLLKSSHILFTPPPWNLITIISCHIFVITQNDLTPLSPHSFYDSALCLCFRGKFRRQSVKFDLCSLRFNVSWYEIHATAVTLMRNSGFIFKFIELRELSVLEKSLIERKATSLPFMSYSRSGAFGFKALTDIRFS